MKSTPEQRFVWLEEMLELLQPQMPRLMANRERERERERQNRKNL